jgi:hypothetical protein
VQEESSFSEEQEEEEEEKACLRVHKRSVMHHLFSN